VAAEVSARLSEVWAQRHLAQPIWEQRAWESMGSPLKRAVCRCGLSSSRAQEWPARARRTIWLGRLSNRGKTETCRSCEVPPSRNRCQGLATLPTPFPEAHPKLPGRQNLSNEQQPRTIVLSKPYVRPDPGQGQLSLPVRSVPVAHSAPLPLLRTEAR
jgi:hypothetical protein